jgi:hypothetical protein
VNALDEAGRALTNIATRCPSGYAGTATAEACDDASMPGFTFRADRPFADFVIAAQCQGGRGDVCYCWSAVARYGSALSRNCRQEPHE